MEAAEFKDRNADFPLPKTASQSPTFSSQNGFHSSRFRIPDIEMTAVQSLSLSSSVQYTSLKDLLPSASPATVFSPTPSSSWHEIPITNPLVKHAAMAYLQPLSTPTTSFGDKGGLLGKLKELGLCGCFGWLCDVVSGTVKEVFCEFVLDRRRDSEEEEEEEEDDDDDDDEDYDKVD